MDFSPDIQKDAYLNYARLSYEIGNAYEPVPDVISQYLERYPSDEHEAEMKNLLVDSFITSRNFKGALELLESNRDYASKETYQKVTYFRALDLYEQGATEAAAGLLETSLGNAVNPLFEARAQYWKAEADYLLNDFPLAAKGFIRFKSLSSAAQIPEYKDVDYSLAYAYFKQKNYNDAIAYFADYSSGSSLSLAKKNDAYLRLGDSYFATRKYWPAIESYNKAIAMEGSEKDYATYQKAMSYGFVDRVAKKIENLSDFERQFPKSSFKDDALYELGNTYVSEGDTQKGLKVYDRLITGYKASSLVPQALMRQGLVHYNANNNTDALAKFKTVVRDYPKSQEAVQAVATQN